MHERQPPSAKSNWIHDGRHGPIREIKSVKRHYQCIDRYHQEKVPFADPIKSYAHDLKKKDEENFGRQKKV